MRDEIKQLVEEYPKHFSQKIKKDKDLLSWVYENSEGTCKTLSERVYQSLSGKTSLCVNGKHKKFKSIKDGYGYCARTKDCLCAQQNIGKKVSNTKQNYTQQQKGLINKKREETNLEKYGVINAGQTDHAKQKHKEFYDDVDKVTEVTLQSKQTKLEKYGNETYNNRDKAADTVKKRYNVHNPGMLTEYSQNPNLKFLHDKDEFIKIYEQYSIEEISEKYGVHIQTVYRWSLIHGCREKFKSIPETEVADYLISLGVTNIVRNSRKIIPSGKEIDIYLPDYKIAIEYNGIYWHHENVQHIDKYYHYNKFAECEKLGIQLITIFSNVWDEKKDLAKLKIRSKLGFVNDSVYARKCYIKQIKSSESKEIMNKYHIQGFTPSSVCYGLFYNDDMVSCMTFSKPRPGIGKRNHDENTYELVRYVSKIRVVGGASKLFTHFIKEYDPSTVISYSDNEWNTGRMYGHLGFYLHNVQKTNYWYFHSTKKTFEHRYKYTKYKLVEQGFDPSKTEREIMAEQGYLRVWDCGNKVWHWNK